MKVWLTIKAGVPWPPSMPACTASGLLTGFPHLLPLLWLVLEGLIYFCSLCSSPLWSNSAIGTPIGTFFSSPPLGHSLSLCWAFTLCEPWARLWLTKHATDSEILGKPSEWRVGVCSKGMLSQEGFLQGRPPVLRSEGRLIPSVWRFSIPFITFALFKCSFIYELFFINIF